MKNRPPFFWKLYPHYRGDGGIIIEQQAFMFSKLYLFWLVLIFQFKFVLWGTWSGDIYPIFHGGYVSNWYGDGVQEEYVYWHLEDIYLKDMNLYSNDDLLLTYISQIQHNPLFFENMPKHNSILVKTDSKVGTTIWAKEIFDYSISVNLEIVKSFLINDTAWSLLFTHLYGVNIVEYYFINSSKVHSLKQLCFELL